MYPVRQTCFALAVAAIAISLIGGCTAGNGARGTGTLHPAASPYEPGVPVPVGFRLVDKSSEDWSSGPLRYLRHRYQGRADKYAVRRFYREQMPLVRWTAINDGNVQGRITMRFQRGSESCTISIEDLPGGLYSRVSVEVMITPLPR